MKRTIIWIFSLFIVSILSVYFNDYKRINNYNKAIKNSFSWENTESNGYMQDFIREYNIKDDFSSNKILFVEEFPQQFSAREVFFDVEDHLQLNDVVGVSFGMYIDDVVEIYIDNSFWESTNQSLRRKLIYHELGHDILNLDHSENPKDFMFPFIIR